MDVMPSGRNFLLESVFSASCLRSSASVRRSLPSSTQSSIAVVTYIQWLTFCAGEVSAAPALDPRWRQCSGPRVLTRTSLWQCVARTCSPATCELRSTAKHVLGLDASVDVHCMREMVNIISTWHAKLQDDAKAKVDAVARAHREPTSRLPGDWEAMMDIFRGKYGQGHSRVQVAVSEWLRSFQKNISMATTSKRRHLHRW